jgi:hypothetical protein
MRSPEIPTSGRELDFPERRLFFHASEPEATLAPTNQQAVSELLKQTHEMLERAMFSKTKYALFALAAVVTVGAASLVASPADARGFGGGFHAHGAMHVGGARMSGGARFGGLNRGGFNRGGFNRIGGFHPRFAFNHFNHFRPGWNHWGWRHRWYSRPYFGGGYAVGGAALGATYAAAPAQAATAPTCTCLRKDYTQDGQVVFQDVCTKEVAAAPVGNQAMAPDQNQQQQ